MSNLWILYLGEFLQSDPRGKVYGINEFSHLLEVSGKKATGWDSRMAPHADRQHGLSCKQPFQDA